jgi:hypothetical protein
MKNLILTYFLIFFSVHLFAQFTIDGAEMKIESDALISINQNCTNYGKVYNDGSMYLFADWNNQGFYEPASGNFILNGTSNQNVYHNGVFNNLIISGSGDKYFTSGAKILSNLNLTDGIIFINENDSLILSSTAISVNSSVLSFVNGIIYCQGGGYKFFPIGKDNVYAPIELTNVQNDNSLTGFEVFLPNIITDFEVGIQAVSEDRYWEVSNTEINSQIILSNDFFFSNSEYPNLIVVEADEENLIFRNIGNFSPNLTDYSKIKSKNNISGKYFALALIGQINSTLFIPSALSPYATNEDDRIIKIYGDNFVNEDFSFQIYNKWGNLIFSTTSLQEMKDAGWNGINQRTGNQEATGMYSYILKAKNEDGNSFQKSGTIMIIK